MTAFLQRTIFNNLQRIVPTGASPAPERRVAQAPTVGKTGPSSTELDAGFGKVPVTRSGLDNREPSYSPEWLMELGGLFGMYKNVPEDEVPRLVTGALSKLRAGHGPAPYAGAANVSIANTGSPGLQSRWESYVTSLRQSGNVDVGALVQWVLRESYLATTEDLRFYAEKVQFYNKLKKAIREELSNARNKMSGAAGLEDNDVLPGGGYPKKDFDANFSEAAGDPEARPVTRAELGTGVSVQVQDQVPAALKTAAESRFGGNVEWVKTTEGEFVATNLSANHENGMDDLMIFVPNKTSPSDYHVTAIWGDPHVDELKLVGGKLSEVGTPSWDFHFGVDSEFVLPSGTRILVNSEQRHANQWTAEGISIIAGKDRIRIGELDDGSKGAARVSQDGAEAYKQANLQMFETVDGKRVKTGGHFALQDNGQWAILGDDGQFHDVQAQSWNDFTSSKANANAGGSALLYGAAQVVAGSATQGYAYTKKELQTYIENLESKLNSVGDDAQLANVDLQSVLQKQQQTLQMMSNISKMLYDTGMSIIRKLGG